MCVGAERGLALKAKANGAENIRRAIMQTKSFLVVTRIHQEQVFAQS